MPDTKHTCMSCGGEVSEDGYALILDEPEGPGHEGKQEKTEQQKAGDSLHEGAFADAVKRKRGA